MIPAPPEGCWLRWRADGAEVPLERPLALAVVEDLLTPWVQDDAPAGAAEAPALSAAGSWLLAEALRRACLKADLAAPSPALLRRVIPGPGGSVQAFLAENLRTGAFPGLDRPVDAASLRPLPEGDFVAVSRCGAWKNSRIQQVFDARFGAGTWRSGYTWGRHTLDVRSGIDVYEDGYRAALAADPELLAWVLSFGEVYDTAPSNVAAYCDYSVQEVEGAGQHWQDVAIRRSLRRLGVWFRGEGLLEIRGQESGGYRLNPGQLAFHRPDRLVEPRQYAWWRPGSVEDFSVSNFCVQAPLAAALAWLEAGPIDEDRCVALAVAQHPATLPLLPRFAQAGARPALAAARAVSLMDPRPSEGVPAEIDALASRIAALPDPQRQILDRALADEPLTRRDALSEVESGEDRAFSRWMLEIFAEDPARKLRLRAKQALEA